MIGAVWHQLSDGHQERDDSVTNTGLSMLLWGLAGSLHIWARLCPWNDSVRPWTPPPLNSPWVSRLEFQTKLTLVLRSQRMPGSQSTVSEVSSGGFILSSCIFGSLGGQVSRDQASNEASTVLAMVFPPPLPRIPHLTLGRSLNLSLSPATSLYPPLDNSGSQSYRGWKGGFDVPVGRKAPAWV